MTPTQTVSKFYQLNNEIPAGKASFEDLKPLLADDSIFIGPLMRIEGADNYVGLLKRFLSFHESLRITKQFTDKNDVCTITELTVKTPSGQLLKMDIAERIAVENGKLKSHTIYYDPRAFMEAFPM